MDKRTYTSGKPSTGKFVTYLRVSTNKQGRDGNGIKAQREACKNFLNGGRWEILKEFVEVESGSNDKRPKLEQALELVHKTGATLLVAKLDRLSRSAAFTSRLMQARTYGIKFVCADMPDANDLTIHIIAAAAEHERRNISERTKAALAAVKKSGKKLGSKKIKQVARQGRAARSEKADAFAERVYPIIERIRDKQGITSLRGIAEELNERGIETASRQSKIDKGLPVFGSPYWKPQQVKLIIERMERG